MNVYLLSAYTKNRANYASTLMVNSSQNDVFKVHKVVDNLDLADIIIFVEHHPGHDPYFFEVIENSVYKKYKNKCYLYHDNDIDLTLLPTISPSVECTKFIPFFHESFSYIAQIETNIYIKNSVTTTEKEYLFSFIGASRTSLVREKIFNLSCDDCYLLDTSDKNSWEIFGEDREEYFKKYADICYKSKFILCPRGIGPNSYRLYETLKMGIVPVIISDEWIPQNGPNWQDFSICVKEKDIDSIPEILKENEARYLEMGQLARRAWEDYFSEDKQFHYLVEACSRLHSNRKKISFSVYLKQLARFLEPYHAKNLLRYCRYRLTKK